MMIQIQIKKPQTKKSSNGKRFAQRDDEKEEIENDIRERKHKKENKKLFKDKDKKFFLEIL